MPPHANSTHAPLLGSISLPTFFARSISYGHLAADTRAFVLDILDDMEQAGIQGDPALDAALARFEGVKDDVKSMLAQRRARWMAPVAEFSSRRLSPFTNGPWAQAAPPAANAGVQLVHIVQVSPPPPSERALSPEVLVRVSPDAAAEHRTSVTESAAPPFDRTSAEPSSNDHLVPPTDARPAPTPSPHHVPPITPAVHATDNRLIPGDLDGHAPRPGGLVYPSARNAYRVRPSGGPGTTSTGPAQDVPLGSQIPVRAVDALPAASLRVLPPVAGADLAPPGRNEVSARKASKSQAKPSGAIHRTPLDPITTYAAPDQSTPSSRVQLPVSWVRSEEQPPSASTPREGPQGTGVRATPPPPRTYAATTAPNIPPIRTPASSAELPANESAAGHGATGRVAPPPHGVHGTSTTPSTHAAPTHSRSAQPMTIEQPPAQVGSTSQPLDPSALPSVGNNGMAYGFVPKPDGGWQAVQLPVTRTANPTGTNSPPAQVEILGHVYSLQPLPRVVAPTASSRAPTTSAKRPRDGGVEHSHSNVPRNNFTVPTFYPAAYDQAFQAAAIPPVPASKDDVERPAKRVRKGEEPERRALEVIDLTEDLPIPSAVAPAQPAATSSSSTSGRQPMCRRGWLVGLTENIRDMLSCGRKLQEEILIRDDYVQRFKTLDSIKATLTPAELRSTGLCKALQQFSEQTAPAFHGPDKLAEKAQDLVSYWNGRLRQLAAGQ